MSSRSPPSLVVFPLAGQNFIENSFGLEKSLNQGQLINELQLNQQIRVYVSSRDK